jgi:hypothetical protein
MEVSGLLHATAALTPVCSTPLRSFWVVSLITRNGIKNRPKTCPSNENSAPIYYVRQISFVSKFVWGVSNIILNFAHHLCHHRNLLNFLNHFLVCFVIIDILGRYKYSD